MIGFILALSLLSCNYKNDCTCKNPDNIGLQMDKVEDWLKAPLELPMDTLPGTKYAYSGPNNIILGEIVKRTTGLNISD